MLLPRTFIIPPVPRTLYHYTDQGGMLGILGKKELWATDIRYLNDSSEFRYGKQLVEDTLKARQIDDPSNAAFYQGLIDSSDYSSEFQFFVVSLSEEKDSLGQWRGYTPHGRGFNLGFYAPALQENLRFYLDVSFAKCVYEPSSQVREIDKLVDEALRLYARQSDPKSYLRGHKSQLAAMGLFFKHLAFQAENEWRIVLTMPQDANLEFRPGLSMLTPYIPVSIMRGIHDNKESVINPNNQVPICEVIVGPTPHPELSKQSVEMLLRSKQVKAVAENSAIPFRVW